jgi:anti-anti-sigma regulatory factor
VSAISWGITRGVPVVRLVGEVGREQGETLSRELCEALGTTHGAVLVDLRSTRHIHYRVAGLLAEFARTRGRVGLVGPSPYVRQILRSVGATEGDLPEYRTLREAMGGHAA